jgi:uncharacterized cofD-like protein
MRQSERKKIVVIGGGTGSFQILKGLKLYTNEITAIVSMFDSGGSTGTLRDEFGILPPGDLRKCLVALASEDDEDDLRRLFMYRFPARSSINGHSFGNLFITALTEIYGGDIARAAEQAGKLMKIKGKIYPVTKYNAHLCAVLENGQEIIGEDNIDIPKHDSNLKIKEINLTRPVCIYDKAEKAIANADMIVLGPGDLYTSILPNFLVDGMKEALKTSLAKQIYVCNVMTKRGETNHFKASDFLAEIVKYTGNCPLYGMICNNRNFSPEILAKYKEEGAEPVEIDRDNIYGVRLIHEDVAKEKDVARHDPVKVASLLMSLL